QHIQNYMAGLVQVSAVHLQTGNLRLGTTYILACILDRNIQAKQGDKYQRGFSELRLNQGDNPFQHYYYPFISEQKGNANMHVLNLFSTFNLSVHYVYANIYSYSSL
uniref:Uncharacterized protein n=1 Tax=Zosterops lateralis melanops TaxID=1220523 RepID=A0A8D2PQV9_ZOSLA